MGARGEAVKVLAVNVSAPHYNLGVDGGIEVMKPREAFEYIRNEIARVVGDMDQVAYHEVLELLLSEAEGWKMILDEEESG